MQVGLFIGLTLALSFALEAFVIVRYGGILGPGILAVSAVMWLPGLLSIALRLVQRDGFRDVGWRAGKLRYWGLAFVVPVSCAAFTYGVSWVLGVVEFTPPAADAGLESPVTKWIINSTIGAAFGMVIASVLALGEELGWRGYLITRMVEGKLPFALLLAGLVWSVWHVPLILWGDYATSVQPWVSALQFVGTVTVAAVFFGWLRLASGSIWPPVIAHAAHNIYYQSTCDRWFAGELEPYLAGEQGLFSMLAYGLVALFLLRTGRLERAVREPVLYAVGRNKR